MLTHLRYCLSLPGFLKHPLSADDCHAILREGWVRREANFLAVLRASVYDDPASPYRRLLEHARCSFADVESMVHKHGLEATLASLSRAGVYISIEEYKGITPVVRDGLSFRVEPASFDNPAIVPSLVVRSGGTRSHGNPTSMSFDYLTDGVAVEGVEFDELRLRDAPYALWFADLTTQLDALKRGTFPARWFYPPSTRRNAMAARFTVAVGRMLGHRIAWPEPTRVTDAHRVARWLADTRAASRPGVLFTNASSAVRVVLAAREHALDISGSHFLTGSEPLTPARAREIRAAGCTVTAHYATIEAGIIGCGCRHATGDEMHVIGSRAALVERVREIGRTGVTVSAALLTTLLPSAPKIFINVETGDYLRLAVRACGCRFDEIGFTQHISEVRSYEKLTSEGMTYFAGDLAAIVEDVLPARFGGSALHYQAVEGEDAAGFSRIRIVISPDVGAVDETAVIETILDALSRGGAPDRRLAQVWREAGTLQVERDEPHATKRGKVFPFHVAPPR